MSKYTIFIDMDGVLANFDGQVKSPKMPGSGLPSEMLHKGFFLQLGVMEGAKEAIAELEKLETVELFIATKISTKNLHAATEKMQWIEEHFPSLLKNIFIACDKTKLRGDMLIDDFQRWKNFPGHFFHFDHANPKQSWQDAVAYIKEHFGAL